MAFRFLLFLVLAGLVVILPRCWTDGSHEPDWLESAQSGPEVRFFQPDSNLFAALDSEVVFLEDLEPSHYEKRNDSIIIIDNVPFYRYWQLDREDAFAFHPSALGGLLFSLNQNDDQRLPDFYEGALKTAVMLPNGGRAWYFPKVYPLNRMVGPSYAYSALTQGRILSAALALTNKHPSQYDDFLEQTARGMLFPYREGGVLWDDEVFLEYPTHFAPPEVILNGWIDALLAYGDYAKQKGDDESLARLNASLRAMSEMLPLFDDEARKLSLYSDVAPVVVNIKKTRKNQKFDLSFTPIDPARPAYETRLGKLEPGRPEQPEKKSPYDTQILIENDEEVLAFLSCNQKYKTVLSSAAPFQIQFNTGSYSETAATPAPGGKEILLESGEDNDLHTVYFEQYREEMFCGYPTNFAKGGGENFYHVHHIVGLSVLAKYYTDAPAVCQNLLEYARRWMAYTEEHRREGRKFTDYQKILSPMSRLRPFPVSDDWPTLRQWAETASCA